MLKKNLIVPDTNVFIRFLVGDDEPNYQKAIELFVDIESEKVNAILLESVFAEIVFVLEKIYKVEKKILADQLLKIIGLRGIRTNNKELFIKALEIYQTSKIDIVDCILAAHSIINHTDIFTFDNELKKLIQYKNQS